MPYGFYDKPRVIELPHPPVALAVFLTVEAAMLAAWNILRVRRRPGFDLSNADEDIVTQELYEVLSDQVFDKGVVGGFDRELFTDINRESKFRSYNYAHLDKMPDLNIGLVGRQAFYPSQDRIFMECKPVDSTHTVGKHYCGMGIFRFVRGEYAWTMTSVLMIGYVREDYRIVPKLTDALNRVSHEISTIGDPYQCSKSEASLISEAVYISHHARRFEYVETRLAAPDITIRHLWLRRD